MLDGLLGAPLAVVILGIAASIGWGMADFAGGLASRRAPLLGVLVLNQVAALAVAVPLTVAAGEPPMGTPDLVLAVVAGVTGSLGLSALYRGLSTGRMGVVAPTAGILTALVPVTVALVWQGLPTLPVGAGIALTMASVVLVTRSDDGSIDRPSGLRWGVLAGVGFGLFVLAISQLSDGLVFSPLSVVRAVEGLVAALLIVITRSAWRVPRSVWPLVIVSGVLDMGANVAFLDASHPGPLAIAASLSSLYPVVTVLLAAAVLRERITLPRALGVAVAGLAIALIAGGRA